MLELATPRRTLASPGFLQSRASAVCGGWSWPPVIANDGVMPAKAAPSTDDFLHVNWYEGDLKGQNISRINIWDFF